MSELRTRDAVEADLAAVLNIRTRSFGPLESGGDTWWQAVSEETLGGRMLVVTDADDTIVGAGRIQPYSQPWGGRYQAMGGVAGVYVEPSARGQGVAGTLMRALIARMGELGDAISCLYPTAPMLYRSVGYEVGGTSPKVTYAAPALRGLRAAAGSLRPRPATPDDAELIQTILRDQQVRNRTSGQVLPRLDVWKKELEDKDSMFYVLDGTAGGPRGFVSYGLKDEILRVEYLAADNEQATAALWSVVASGSSAAPKVATFLDPRDVSTLMLPAHPETETSTWLWMLRVVDLAKAVAARGFSPYVNASASIAVNDPDAQANTGAWQVSVADGAGSITATAERPNLVQFGPRGVAALWSGWGMAKIRQVGLAVGGDREADSALDAIFEAQPFMTQYF